MTARRWTLNELQHPEECRMFAGLLAERGVRSYLEIGCRFGGSMWTVANSLPVGSRLVGVEIDPTPELRDCVSELRTLHYDVRIIEGHSGASHVIDLARDLAPYDALLIDGAHDYSSVMRDWEGYEPMTRKLVAFHDVSASVPRPEKPWKGDVRRFYESLKTSYHTFEIEKPGGIGFGIVDVERNWP